MQKQRQPEYELVPLTEERSFAVREFRALRFPSPWHLHPEFELTWVRAGTGIRFIGDNVAAFAPGDLVLVGPTLPHCWRSAAADAGAVSRSIVIQFREDCLGADFFRRPELRQGRMMILLARRAKASALPLPPRVAGKKDFGWRQLAKQSAVPAAQGRGGQNVRFLQNVPIFTVLFRRRAGSGSERS